MRYKKKKGSTLLVVVCLCAFLSVLTLSIMLVTTGGFKLRKEENTRIEKFYSADSGIEIAKNETTKVIKEAIQKGNERVKAIEEKDSENDPNIYDDNSIQYYYEDYNKGKLKPNYQQEGFKRVFERYIEMKLRGRIDNREFKASIYKEFKRNNSEIKVGAKLKEISPRDGDYKPGTERYQIWGIESSFREDENDNERIVQVDYRIKTPDYGREVKEKKGGDTNVFDYIIGVDGKLDVSNKGTFDGIGDMWIGGGEDPDSNGSKMDLVTYKPAIKLKATPLDAEFKWTGNLITPGEIFIEGGSLKANNLYADSFLYKAENTEQKKLEVDFNGDMFLSNDLIFHAKNTKLKVKNYYGLDETTDKEIQNSQASERSSSIIVKSEDFGKKEGSFIEIENDAYVGGTAYLQLDGEPYQTGESIAINRFSEPYTNRSFIENNKNYLYKYLDPLHIVYANEENGQKLNTGEKAELVTKYLTEKNILEENDIFKGLNIKGKTYSSGILYNNGKIIPRNTIDENKKINDKRKEFLRETYNMGDKILTEEVYDFFIGEDKKKREAVKEKKYNKVHESFEWDFIRNNIMKKNELIENEKVVFERVFPKANYEVDDIAIFQSKMNIEEIFKNANSDLKIEETSDVNNFFKNNIIIIFNSSERKSKAGNAKKLYFKPQVTEVEQKNNRIDIPLEYINSKSDIFVVISDGDINIIQPYGPPTEVRGAFYSSENINISIESTVTFGNISVPGFTQINKIFKELFKLEIFEGVVNGSKSDKGESEYIINVSDLLEQENWKLIK